jgi:hypothetical protein
MKNLYTLFLLFVFAFSSCNKISDKPVSEKLSTKELSKALKSDTLFADFYEIIREEVDQMSDIKKAKYNDITYRRLFKYVKHLQDTSYWNPMYKKLEKEWKSEYGMYLPKADSVLNYWKKYLEDNTLDKYVKIDLAKIDIEYYRYVGGIKDVSLGFRLTPLQGTVDQIVFTYGYQAKIHEDNQYYKKIRCRSTTPFSSTTVRFWKVGYSDEKLFSGHNVETFLRDYNLYIEITDIRKDGVNISIDDFTIPIEVSNSLQYENKYPALFESSIDELIKEMLNKDYLSKWEYKRKKSDEILEKKDKRSFEFLKEL